MSEQARAALLAWAQTIDAGGDYVEGVGKHWDQLVDGKNGR